MRRVLNQWYRLLSAYRTTVYRGHFVDPSTKAQFSGPIIWSGTGKIIGGENLYVRSKPHLPVDIHIGREARLILGKNVFLNQGVRIVCDLEILIGDNCQIGDETLIIDSDYHSVGARPIKQAPICISDRVWVASRVVILRGVTIGQGSVIGAGSVVTRSIPPNTFAAGAPARVIHELSD